MTVAHGEPGQTKLDAGMLCFVLWQVRDGLRGTCRKTSTGDGVDQRN
jgi:hypothetical protein